MRRFLKYAAAAAILGLFFSVGGPAAYAVGEPDAGASRPNFEFGSSHQRPSNESSDISSDPEAPSSESSSSISSDSSSNASSDSSSNVSSDSSSDASSDSSSNPSSETSSPEPIPDQFLVMSGEKDITAYFSKNGSNISGQVPHSISQFTVTLAERGVRDTVTFTMNTSDGKPVSNGLQFEFTMALVTISGNHQITDYYIITVVREYNMSQLTSSQSPATSQPPVSSKVPSSELPTTSAPSSAEPSSDGLSSEISSVQSDGSSSTPAIIGGVSSDEPRSDPPASNIVDRFKDKNHNWLFPVAILLIVLGVGGIAFVIWEILKMRGVIPAHTEPEGEEPEDGFVDILGENAEAAALGTDTAKSAEQPNAGSNDDQIDIDAFFNTK